MSDEPVAATGSWGIVTWAAERGGDMPARAFIRSGKMTPLEKKKAWALLSHLAEVGNRLAFQASKFKKLGDKAAGEARDLFELRPTDQIRFLGEFREGKRFVVAIGLRKKQDDLRPEEMRRALRVLSEDREQQAGGGR